MRRVLMWSSRWIQCVGSYDGAARCWKVRTENGYGEGSSFIDAAIAAGAIRF